MQILERVEELVREDGWAPPVDEGVDYGSMTSFAAPPSLAISHTPAPDHEDSLELRYD